jgi:hypothetical protein
MRLQILQIKESERNRNRNRNRDRNRDRDRDRDRKRDRDHACDAARWFGFKYFDLDPAICLLFNV